MENSTRRSVGISKIIVYSCAYTLGITWLLAAVGKMTADTNTWEELVTRAFGNTGVTEVIISLELAMGICLVAQRSRLIVAISSILLIIAFSIVSYLKTHDPTDCHCFGNIAALDKWPVARNASIVALSICIAIADRCARIVGNGVGKDTG